MTYSWVDLEGVCLAGEYGLDQWLGSEPSGAFFLTSFGTERQRAVLKLVVVEDPSTAEGQVALWQRAARLTHPSLMALLDCGLADHGNTSFLFVVFEAPDDSLTAAIQNGPLSTEEARDILVAAMDALHYLHARGWAHTSIDAEHVVAVGDRIKLSSDTLSDGGSQTAQSDDVWALGALIYELVTTRRIAPGDAVDLSGISEPLRTMIQHAVEPDVQYRWTAAQMTEALNPGPAGDVPAAIGPIDRALSDEPRFTVTPTVMPPVPPVAEPSPAHQESAAAGLVPGDHGSSPSAILIHEPYSNLGHEEAAHPPSPPAQPSPFARYVPVAAAAAVALLAIVFVVAHHGTPAPPAVAIVPPPVSEPAARVIPASAPKVPLSSWRVIAYTYSRQEDAEKKAQSINSRFAGVHAEVFTVGSSHLVSLGAHLTREQAAALQRKAIGKGLPHDTYIQNFRAEE